MEIMTMMDSKETLMNYKNSDDADSCIITILFILKRRHQIHPLETDYPDHSSMYQADQS